MSDPILVLYCAECSHRVHVDRVDASTFGETKYINGTMRCTTPGCLSRRGVVNASGDPVDV